VRAVPQVRLSTVLVEWGRIGFTGFGGPPTHIRMLRDLCVVRRHWMDEQEFSDAIAACNLLPGPASTQLSIYCGWRIRRTAGAIVGGLAFIVPGLAIILALAALFLAGAPPLWIRGAAAGAGSAVAAVAVHAGAGMLPASWRTRRSLARWWGYLAVGAAAAATAGPWLVVLLLACGGIEVLARRTGRDSGRQAAVPIAMTVTAGGATLLSVAWVALKVGLFSYGGGFVIIPLMQTDAVNRYHWMTSGQFLNAVALGQVTPGPVVHTVAVVGYAASGVGGGLVAAFIAFVPSFMFVLIGGPHFDRLRTDTGARAFLDGAGPAAIGAILGSAIPLTRALTELWQFGLLGLAAVVLLALHRSVVSMFLVAGAIGVVIALAGGPLPN
jgi:chromate transporter